MTFLCLVVVIVQTVTNGWYRKPREKENVLNYKRPAVPESSGFLLKYTPSIYP